MNSQLSFEVLDPTTSGVEFVHFSCGQSRLLTTIDAILSASGVDRLATHPEFLGHFSNGPSTLEQIDCSSAKH
jgi:hypothetical protein